MKYLKLCGLLVFLLGCGTSSKLNRIDIAPRYNARLSNVVPKHRLIHQNESASQLLISVIPSTLKKQSTPSGTYVEFQVQASIYKDADLKELVDSVEIRDDILIDSLDADMVNYSKQIEMPKGQYIMELVFRDMRGAEAIKIYEQVNKNGSWDAESFQVSYRSLNNWVYDWVHVGKEFQIRNEWAKKHDIYMFFSPVASIPAPPVFTQAKIPELKIDKVHFKKLEKGQALKFDEPGTLFLRTDTTRESGLAMIVAPADFPQMKTSYSRVECLRYVTKNFEFEKLLKVRDQNKTILDYWLSRAGSSERARVLMDEYYERVSLANQWFSGMEQGWCTDKGLVFIIYGPPDEIYNGQKGEEWRYHEKVGYQAVNFTFVNLSEAYGPKYHKLIREYNFVNSWNMAIHQWRHGRIEEITAD